jgi:hypothetical protein
MRTERAKEGSGRSLVRSRVWDILTAVLSAVITRLIESLFR